MPKQRRENLRSHAAMPCRKRSPMTEGNSPVPTLITSATPIEENPYLSAKIAKDHLAIQDFLPPIAKNPISLDMPSSVEIESPQSDQNNFIIEGSHAAKKSTPCAQNNSIEEGMSWRDKVLMNRRSDQMIPLSYIPPTIHQGEIMAEIQKEEVIKES